MGKKRKEEDPKQHVPLSKRIKMLLVVIGLTVIFGLIGYAAILFGGKLVVDEEKMILDVTTTIETGDGKIIGKLYNENRLFVDIERVPEHVKNAFIAVEDTRFYEHAGIDFRSVIRAIYRDIIAMSKVEGASTITQQLAKNLFLYNDKTWTRKAKEAMAAIYLERKLPKDRILELYVNEIYFGSGIYGIEAASNYFFSKSVGDLTIAEGALLAGLAKAPNGYSPINHPEKALNRRNTVLHSMENADMLSTEKRVQEQGKTLGLNVQKREATPWTESYIDLVMKEAADKQQLSINELKRGGYRIVVNMDENAQTVAYEKFQNDAYFPGNTDGVQGAFIMMEQKSGKIVAVIGGREYQLGNLNRVTVNRQPGSTMKPIAVYGPALMEEENYTAYSLLPDQPMDAYSVENSNGQYDNSVSIYNAIKTSKNAPAVWLLDQIGINYSKEYLEKMNIHIDDDGLALALGGLTNGLTPMQMMESYRPFAHEGEFVEAYTIEQIFDRNGEMIFQANPKSSEVFSPQIAWNMTEILMDTVEVGTASAGDYPKALAGKTGSTQHPYAEGKTKDAWFVGYTPQYVSALWMGYDISDKDHYLTAGSEYPTRLTKAILTEMDKQESLADSFTKPDHVNSLPKPIKLPEISDLKANYSFGGISLVKGKLSWTGSDDNRVVYRIYREEDGIDQRVGEVEGKTEFVIDNALFRSNQYYVVAYDPLSKVEGERSNLVEMSW